MIRNYYFLLILCALSLSCKELAEVQLSASFGSGVRQEEESLVRAVTDQNELQPFLNRYCVECHGSEEQKGQVRLDQMEWEITTNDSAQRWQDVLDQLHAGEMPPEDASQPSVQELTDSLAILTSKLQVAKARLIMRDGEIPLRRLNRREYAATIKELFGFDVNLYEIPEDPESDSFDTVSEEQLFTSKHLEKYLILGTRIAKSALAINTRPYQKSSIERKQPEKKVNTYLRKTVDEADRKKAIRDAGGDWKEMGFKDEGDMQILFNQWVGRVEKPRRYLQYPKVKDGVYISDIVKTVSVDRHVDIRGDYIIRVKGGVHDPKGDVDDLRRIIRVRDNDKVMGTLKFHGTPDSPDVAEISVRQELGKRRLSAHVRENMPNNTINSIRRYVHKLGGRGEPGDPLAAVWIDWLEMEGPIYAEERPVFEELLYPDLPTGGGSPYLEREDLAKELITQFAYHAFRRLEPAEDYVDALYAHFLKQKAEGVKPLNALAEVMGVVLASPSFLYMQEAGATGSAERSSLDARELAVRLSYFLWGSPPDEELYLADLLDPTVYEQQVERLLAHEKSEGFRDGFINQWAELARYDSISVDRQKHIHFNEGLQEDAKQEVREFFGILMNENLPVENLIHSDFVAVNAALAVHYELLYPKPQSGETGEFTKLELPPNSPRGGLLTQTAFLVAGSNGERSSPVVRGSLVLEKILHDKPSPPPPNVPEIGSENTHAKTNRELIMEHQKQPSCASCHRKIDPVGFGLENFDTTGRWREKEKVGRQQYDVDPSGELPNGHYFDDLQEFKYALLSSRHQLAEELIESFLSYGLGRRIEFSDQVTVDQILADLEPQKYPMKDVIKAVAMSSLFKLNK